MVYRYQIDIFVFFQTFCCARPVSLLSPKRNLSYATFRSNEEDEASGNFIMLSSVILKLWSLAKLASCLSRTIKNVSRAHKVKASN